jgi:hypothetical protein
MISRWTLAVLPLALSEIVVPLPSRAQFSMLPPVPFSED